MNQRFYGYSILSIRANVNYCRLIDGYCLGPGWKMKRQDLFSQYIGRGVDNRIIQICETAVVLINWLPMPPHHELRGEVILDRKEWRVMSNMCLMLRKHLHVESVWIWYFQRCECTNPFPTVWKINIWFIIYVVQTAFAYSMVSQKIGSYRIQDNR